MAETILNSYKDGVILFYAVIFLVSVNLTASVPLLKCNQIGNDCITITSFDNLPPNKATYTIDSETRPPPCPR